MADWTPSRCTVGSLEALVARGLLMPRTDAMEWLVPGNEALPAPPDGYVVSFRHFHERGLGMPPHPFFRGILHHYGLELQHLNPNSVQHLAAFVALCEGFLGIAPHFRLFKHFFDCQLVTKKDTAGNPRAVPIGSASFRLRGGRSRKYISIALTDSNKGWHEQWFYLRNTAATPLPEFTGNLITAAPEKWHFGVPGDEKRGIVALLEAIEALDQAGVTGVGVIGSYHLRRLAPLQARRRMMSEMGSDFAWEGTCMVDPWADPRISLRELKARLAEAMLKTAAAWDQFDWPVPNHPPMLPEQGAIVFVSF